MARERRLAYAAWLAVCLIWGTTYLAIKIALETMPPSLMGGLRYTLAGSILAGALLARREALPARSTWGGLALLGFLLLGLGNGGVIWAEQWLASGLTAMIVATTPFWMVTIEALLPSGERLRRRQLLGLTLGFSGTLMLLWPDLDFGDLGAGGGTLAGVAALQVACVGWAIGSTYSRRHARQENALGAAALQMLFGGLFMLLAGTALGEWAQIDFSRRSFVAFAYLVVIGGIVGFAAYIYALKHLPIAVVSLYAYINPVIAVALGSLLLDEPFHTGMIAGGAVILGGVAIVRSAGSGRPVPPRRREGREAHEDRVPQRREGRQGHDDREACEATRRSELEEDVTEAVEVGRDI